MASQAQTYTLLVTDKRYSVPTLAFFTGLEADARAAAKSRLDESTHHLSVEVRDGERMVFRVDRPA
ncbi:MAG TPA: hypothetical protein VGI95_22225 [Caulobacteraceae bacterium]|jgi:hypothetical protein